MMIERLLEGGRALDAGNLEMAERIFRTVADADPCSSMARVGLARVALRRGDPAAATALASAALAIDPGNVAAQRLLAGEPAAGGEARIPNPTVVDRGDAARTEPPDEASDQSWPWPDLDDQLARYRHREPGRVARLIGRGGR